jgi:transposase InsO family protein
MPRRRGPPSQTWRTFLQNHASALVALDFFTVPTVTGRVLFVLVVLAHARRRILHVNVTPHPTSAWTRQQLREAFSWEVTPRFLLHDRDAIFDEAFRRSVAAFGLTDVRTAPRSPWQNPYVERLIGSMRRECLDHVIVLSERHVRPVLRAYVDYYHPRAPTWHSGRMPRSRDPSRRSTRDGWWRCRRSAGCIIGTNDVRPERRRPEHARLRGRCVQARRRRRPPAPSLPRTVSNTHLMNCRQGRSAST